MNQKNKNNAFNPPCTSGLRLRRRGFTLVELLVVMVIIGALAAMFLPSFGSALAANRDRTIIAKFQQDFEWTRMRASQPGVTGASLRLNADCSWSSQVTLAGGNAVVDAAHSMTSAAFSAKSASLVCAAVAPMTLPVTFAFNAQGFVAPGGSVSFQGARQTASLQALASGSLVRSN